MSEKTPNFVVVGDGNNIATTGPNEVNVNGQTVQVPAGGTLVVNGNKITVRQDKR